MDFDEIVKVIAVFRAKEEARHREGLDFRFNRVRGTEHALNRFLDLLNRLATTETFVAPVAGTNLGIRFETSPHMPAEFVAFFWGDAFVGMLNLNEEKLVRVNMSVIKPSPLPPLGPYDPLQP